MRLEPKSTRPSAFEKVRPKEERAEKQDEERVLVCARCQAVISHERFIFCFRADTAVQVFPNPIGLLISILTLREAEGLVFSGSSTEAFTWFTGYAWTIASCEACRYHLGWRYDSRHGSEPAVFFGLIKTAVAPASGGG